ncbi:MAG: PTS glucose transporter subunit IIA, partial [Clostridia bacterium]|nr:PTS glucose transporter subunit IIA [Clostridia bacterium]
QGNAKTNWIYIVLVGVVYALIYYLIFYYMVTKMDLKTPGREADDEETRLYRRADVEAAKKGKEASNAVSEMIVRGLGGGNNISDLDCCATRLRITVKEPGRVKDELLKASGASGVIHKGNGVQIIYGPQVSVIKSKLEDYLDSGAPDMISPTVDPDAFVPSQLAEEPAETLKGSESLSAHAKGQLIPLESLEDEAFSQKILGDGVAILPETGKLYAPCSGEIQLVAKTRHAINLVSEKGAEILLHVGIDTVKLSGKHFSPRVTAGQKVQKGQVLMEFDLEAIKKAGYHPAIPMIICNDEDYREIRQHEKGQVSSRDTILSLEGKAE